MDVRASVPTDQIDKETAKPLTGDKFDRTKFDTLAADGFVSKEAALGVAPEILATVWGGERIALKASSAEDAFVEFGEYAPKPPDASTMVIPATNLTGVLGLLQCLKRQDTVKVVSGGARKRMRASSFSCGSKNMGVGTRRPTSGFPGAGGAADRSLESIFITSKMKQATMTSKRVPPNTQNRGQTKGLPTLGVQMGPPRSLIAAPEDIPGQISRVTNQLLDGSTRHMRIYVCIPGQSCWV
jgi:hypothetical protein